MTTALRVREMQFNDVDAVFAIELAAHRVPWTQNIIQDCVHVHFDCRVLEIQQEQEQKIIGFIISHQQETICHILNVCIAPDFQGKGYGRFLLNNQIDSLKDTSMNSILLEARPSNLAALHLYQKLGFQKVGVKQGYYTDDLGVEDAVVLQKHLS